MLVKQAKIIPIRYKENYTDKINEFLELYGEHEIIDIQYGITSDDDAGVYVISAILHISRKYREEK